MGSVALSRAYVDIHCGCLNASTHVVIYFQLNLEGAKIWSKLEKLHLSHNSIKVVCIIVIDFNYLYLCILSFGLIQ